MSPAILAADDPTVWSWVAVAGIAVLLSLGGYGVVRLNRRRHRAIDEARSKADRVPSDLRFQADPLWMRVIVLAVAIAVAVAARLTIGSGAGIAALCIVVAPFYIRTQRRRTAHRDEVIQSVRARAGSMSDSELTALVDGLEARYGRHEMLPLRRLVPDVPGSGVRPRRSWPARPRRRTR
jgi:hypothetical protein